MRNQKKGDDPVEKISRLSEQLGFGEDEKSVFELKETNDPDIKELILKEGEWDAYKPMFVFDSQHPERAYVFIDLARFSDFLAMLRHTSQENFNLKLEKAIWKHTPLDFQDVWVVAMDKIRHLIEESQGANNALTLDLDEIVSQIKKEHPSLFLNLNDLLAKTSPKPLQSDKE